MLHNFQARSYNLSGDNDVCTKCNHSRIYVREFGSSECGGDGTIPKSANEVLASLQSQLSTLNIALDMRYEALGRYVTNNLGYVYSGVYNLNLVYTADYSKLLSEAQETLKKKQVLEAVIGTLAKEVE